MCSSMKLGFEIRDLHDLHKDLMQTRYLIGSNRRISQRTCSGRLSMQMVMDVRFSYSVRFSVSDWEKNPSR